MALGGMSAQRPIRAVLLDGLGTLVALTPPWPAFAQSLQREHGIALSPAEAEWAFAAEMAYYRAHHHEGRDPASLGELRWRCAEVLRAALPPAAASRLSPGELHAAMLAALRFRAHADALAALPLLRARGIALVVVSNWDVSLPHVLHDVGLGQLLDGVVTSAEVGRPKPAPEMFRAALALARVAPEEALHVGDDLHADVLGAQAAGLRAVLLSRAARSRAARASVHASAHASTHAQSPIAAVDTQPRAPVSTIASLAQLPGLLTATRAPVTF
jgi:putative hydrolase of the HAD superfamily